MTSHSNSEEITLNTTVSSDQSQILVEFNCCEYCGVDEREHRLFQCQEEHCGRWFCNDKLGLKESHIICHLQKANHRKVAVPPEPCTLISCVHCGGANIFGLSVVQYNQKKILLCTETCMNKKYFPGCLRKGAIIIENRISAQYYEENTVKDPQRSHLVTYDFVGDLERKWRQQNSPFQENDNEEYRNWCPPKTRKIYKSKDKYKRIFISLLWAEEKYAKEITKTWTHNKVKIMFQVRNGVLYGMLDLSNVHHFGGKLKVGDMLQVRGEDFLQRGTVRSAVKNEKIQVSFLINKPPPQSAIEFTVGFVWMNVTYKRMRNALLRFANEDVLKNELTSSILGQPLEIKKTEKTLDLAFDFSELERFNLNSSQIEAAQKALRAPYLFLIQGPPGTGKTQTLLAIISQVIKNLNKIGKRFKLLICASSNKAVNNIAERLVENRVRDVCRVFALSKEHKKYPNQYLESIALHKIIQKENPRLKYLMECKERGDHLSLKELKELRDTKRGAEKRILGISRIICCTCATAGDERLERMFFKHVFIDESSQSIEPECLLPLLLGAEKVILAGDHKQIGPIITCTEAKASGLARSLFERLMINQADCHMLQEQYRMHPFIATFPSKHFYDNKLKTPESVKKERQEIINKFSCFKKSPAYFYHVEGQEEIPPTGVSLLNRDEALVVKKLIYGLVNLKIKPRQIGVITPYNGQKAHLIDLLDSREDFKTNLEISSVDGFQGGEKDFIIISCVRSNSEVGLGFLNDEKRLNVMITRARYGMIIVGNAEVLCQDMNWRALLEFCKQRDIIVRGELNNLVPCKVTIKSQNIDIPGTNCIK